MTPDGFMKHRFDQASPEDAIAIAMANKPHFKKPGTSFAYSNTNYVLAARVIEKATGSDDYADEIERRIIAPLKLSSTSVPTRVTLPRPSSRAYSKLAKTATGPTYDVTELNPRLAYGSGQMVSSSADLTRFYSALLRGKLLRPEQLKEMKTTIPSSRDTSRYGLGLVDRKLECGVHVWGHDGGIFGSNSDVVTTEDGFYTPWPSTSTGTGREAPTRSSRRSSAATAEPLQADVTTQHDWPSTAIAGWGAMPVPQSAAPVWVPQRPHRLRKRPEHAPLIRLLHRETSRSTTVARSVQSRPPSQRGSVRGSPTPSTQCDGTYSGSDPEKDVRTPWNRSPAFDGYGRSQPHRNDAP